MSRPNETNYGKGSDSRISDFHKYRDMYDRINYHGTQPFYVENSDEDWFTEEGWYFWDETWTIAYGPFNTRQSARIGLGEYSLVLNGEYNYD